MEAWQRLLGGRGKNILIYYPLITFAGGLGIGVVPVKMFCLLIATHDED